MKICLIYVRTSRQPWFERALEDYLGKINRFCHFEIFPVTSDSSARKERNRKIKKEEVKLLSLLKETDLVLAFDERGRSFSHSRDFSAFLVKKMEMGKSRVVFIIGGAFGLGEEIKSRAHDLLSLSSLTMNHQVAALASVEQIYRAFTIWKGTAYHND